jgi:hypothetical protein
MTAKDIFKLIIRLGGMASLVESCRLLLWAAAEAVNLPGTHVPPALNFLGFVQYLLIAVLLLGGARWIADVVYRRD